MKQTRKQDMFQHQDKPVVKTNGNGNGNESKQLEYEAWKKSTEEISLAEMLKKIGVVEGTSPKGYEALVINPNGVTDFIRYTFPAINAILDYGKYRILEEDEHEAWFDRNGYREAVRSEFHRWMEGNKECGEWRFYDWKDDCFQRSVIDNNLEPRPGDSAELLHWKAEAKSKRFSMMNKHYVLNRIKKAQTNKNSKFLVVLNSEADRAKYRETIKDHLEDTYAAALAADAEHDETVRLDRETRKGHDEPIRESIQERHSDDHKGLLAKICEQTELIVVRVQYPTRKAAYEYTFNPAVDVKVLNVIKDLPLNTKILDFQKA